MRKILRVVSVSMPLIGAGETALADGLSEKVLGILNGLQEGKKASTAIGAVSMAIDAKEVHDGVAALNTYNAVKQAGIPTYADANKALEATKMLGALGGAEYQEVVHEVGKGAARQQIDSANLQKCFTTHDNGCMAEIGKQIDATTKSVNQRTDQEWSSAGIISQSVPGEAGDTWHVMTTVADYMTQRFPQTTDYLLKTLYPPLPLSSSSTQPASSLEPTMKSVETSIDETMVSTSDGVEPGKKPLTVAQADDQWKVVSMEDLSAGSLLSSEDLNKCESYPGFNSDKWAEVFVGWYFVNTQPGEHCNITARDDRDRLHKRYAATCTYSWVNNTVEQVLDVTREDENVIKGVLDMTSSSASAPSRMKITAIYQRCEN